jgi:mycofactocin precursor
LTEGVVRTRTSAAEWVNAPSADDRKSPESAAPTAVTVADAEVATWTAEGGPGSADEPAILEEIEVEELAVDGICGVY